MQPLSSYPFSSSLAVVLVVTVTMAINDAVAVADFFSMCGHIRYARGANRIHKSREDKIAYKMVLYKLIAMFQMTNS